MTGQPTPSPCTSCGHDLHGQRYAWTCCQPCEDWILARLADIELLWPQLPDHLEPGRNGTGARVSGSPTAGRIPPSEAVLNLTGPGGVPDRLARHDAAIRQARGFSALPPRGTADVRLGATVGSLRRLMPWTVQHHHVYDFAIELRKLVEEMDAATGHQPDSVALAEPCPECAGTLRYERTERTVRCQACSTEVDPAKWTARPAA